MTTDEKLTAQRSVSQTGRQDSEGKVVTMWKLCSGHGQGDCSVSPLQHGSTRRPGRGVENVQATTRAAAGAACIVPLTAIVVAAVALPPIVGVAAVVHHVYVICSKHDESLESEGQIHKAGSQQSGV